MSSNRLGARPSWWRRHRTWIVPLVCVPVGYFGLGLLAGLFGTLSHEHHRNGWLLLASLFLFLAAFASPVVFGIVTIRHGHTVYRAWRRSNGHLTKKEKAAKASEDAQAAAWQHAKHLRAALIRKELPPEIPVWGIVPYPGERFFLSGVAGYARYYGTDVTYSQSSVVAFGRPAWVAGALIGNAIGNSVNRNRAQAMAAAQWREHQNVDVLVSNRRIACNLAGRGWLSWDFDAVAAVYPNPSAHNIVLEYGDRASPLSLTGLMVPALSNITVLMTLGPAALETHPSLQALDGPSNNR